MKSLPPIPYVSQWDLDVDGRPLHIISAIVNMIMGWLGGVKVEFPPRIIDLPSAGIFQAAFDKLGIQTRIIHPQSCISVLPGDICLICYKGFNRESVQDKAFTGWSWVIFLDMDDEHVWIHDPNWSGKKRKNGAGMMISLEEWQSAFRGHSRGLTALRLVTPGPSAEVEEVALTPEFPPALEVKSE